MNITKQYQRLQQFAKNKYIHSDKLKRYFKKSAVAMALFLSLSTTTAYGADENLQVNASWGGGDVLVLDITDLNTAEHQQVAVRLSDLIGEDENVPYLMLQAMDILGERTSSVIQIENPLYRPTLPEAPSEAPTAPEQPSVEVTRPSVSTQPPPTVTQQPPVAPTPQAVTLDELREMLALDREVSSLWNYHDLRLTELTLQHGAELAALLDEFDININDALRQEREANVAPRPPMLTPDGAGTVVDNIMTVNDIEFFTVNSTEGAEFFLVIDRQRPDNNVYLLNAVTEGDLHALATQRAIDSGQLPPPHLAQTQAPVPPTEDMIANAVAEALANANLAPVTEAPAPVVEQSGGVGWGLLAFVGLLLGGIVGGCIWVFKTLLPQMKQSQQANDFIEEDTPDETLEPEDHDYHEDDWADDEDNQKDGHGDEDDHQSDETSDEDDPLVQEENPDDLSEDTAGATDESEVHEHELELADEDVPAGFGDGFSDSGFDPGGDDDAD